MEKKLTFYKYIHRLTVIICFLSVLLPIIFWKYIPERIPQHYGALGEPDAWTDKSFMIVLFFFAFMMLGMMCITEYFVKSSGLSPNASEAEKGNLYYIYPMVVIMDFALQVMIAYIVFCCATSRSLGKVFLPFVLAATFGPMVYFIPKGMKAGKTAKGSTEHLKQKENEVTGEVYRSKVDWWLGILLIGSMLTPAYLAVREYIEEGQMSWWLVGTEILILLIFIPLFNMKYILYPDHLVVVCLGKERIPYRNITGMKPTHNPLSSAALSLDRLQIDYKNDRGGHNMILISPKKKKEFIEKVNKKRELYLE